MITFFKKVLELFINKGYGTILTYRDPRRRKIFELITKIYKEGPLIMGYTEAYQLYMCVKRTSKIPGDIAEVGTYLGTSAKIICEAKNERNLYVIDTFEGLPYSGTRFDTKGMTKGLFRSSYSYVKKYLSMYPNVTLIKGIFPDSANPIIDKRFSFVNLDVDLYESTKACLEFFYPRMTQGGIILSHDYITQKGVEKAFEEFFMNKPEVIIEMSGTQCLVVKL